MKQKFEKFLKSPWGLEIWLACPPSPSAQADGRRGNKTIFRSKKSGVAGLLDFIKKHDRKYEGMIIFDKIVGQGAALLAAYLKAKEVWGKTGSKLAAKNLRKFKIKFHFHKTVPNILNKQKKDICPLEKLSFKRSPEEFYRCLISK